MQVPSHQCYKMTQVCVCGCVRVFFYGLQTHCGGKPNTSRKHYAIDNSPRAPVMKCHGTQRHLCATERWVSYWAHKSHQRKGSFFFFLCKWSNICYCSTPPWLDSSHPAWLTMGSVWDLDIYLERLAPTCPAVSRAGPGTIEGPHSSSAG